MQNINNQLMQKLSELKQGQDFIDFQAKIIRTNKSIIGVKTPDIRRVAKAAFAEAGLSFIDKIDFSCYELSALAGLAICEQKDFVAARPMLDMFLKHADNWAEIDIVAGQMKKLVKYNKDACHEYFIRLTQSSMPFTIRMGIVCLMRYFIDENNYKDTLRIVSSIKNDSYYVEMAIAWLISEILIHAKNAYEVAKDMFATFNFSKFVKNKAISKARDSFRVNIEQKELLKGLRND